MIGVSSVFSPGRFAGVRFGVLSDGGSGSLRSDDILLRGSARERAAAEWGIGELHSREGRCTFGVA
jgi:hypothetical protein